MKTKVNKISVVRFTKTSDSDVWCLHSEFLDTRSVADYVLDLTRHCLKAKISFEYNESLGTFIFHALYADEKYIITEL